MKDTKLQQVILSDNVGLYSICFDNDAVNEYEKFLAKYKDNATLNKDFRSIIMAIDRIIANGAIERYFRPEGKYGDDLVALSIDSRRLRLYCLRMSDKVLIVGNGGVKNTKTYEESEELNGYVMDLQKFDALLRQALKEGVVSIERNVITGIQEASFKV